MTDKSAPAAEARIVDPENPTAGMVHLSGIAARAVFAIGLAFSLFQIYTAAFSPISSIALRSFHVGFLLLMTFLLFGWRHGSLRTAIPWYDWALGAFAFALSFYHWYFEAALIQRSGDPTTLDLAIGVAMVALVFEAARRIMGWALPLICIVFVPYALFGRSLPGFLLHRGYDFEQVIDTLYLGTEGLYGVPTYVSATFIFLFILFGAFLERAGMIQLFNDVALGLVGHQKGGAAKVSVISSGLMGTINGSGVANVLTTGQFTIPLMMRFGYRPAFAGAVEATASMGGQIMPPVMGAVAFIMAETIGVPYSEIAIAAVIPALLYYASAFWMVHLEADKRNLVGVPKAQCPSAWRAMLKGWHLILPLAALVYLLFSGFTPLFAGTIGLALTALLIFGGAIISGVGRLQLRILFWIGLGLLFAALQQVGLRIEQVAISLVFLLVAACAVTRGGRATLDLMANGMVDAAKSALGVGVACVLVGILIGITQLTGLASDLARGILAVAGDNLLLALVMTMVACIVLGTGLPTIPNYIITAAMAAPVLKEMGVPLIVSHMFVFYFGIMADLTPPVALAALAASSIARPAGHMEIGWIATRIGMAGYVVPFMAVYAPELMLQFDGGKTWLDTVYVMFKAFLSVGLWGAAASAWLRGPLNWPERIWATAAALFLVVAYPWTDQVGFAMGAAFLAWHWWRIRLPAAAA
jgi:TRAP transporter 4TM/12TM fusion protein